MKRASILARRQRRNHERYRGRNDLNIVPMLDVMVILTFFLIFTAVFSKTSVLEVNLPGPTVQPPPATPTLELEVILRRDGLQVADRYTGILETIPLDSSGRQQVQRLTTALEALKQRYPETSNGTLLVADDVDYDMIVQVMDAMRAKLTIEGAKVTHFALFPEISLGDAPK
jgi:biopolymer transport protein ExbD